MKHNMGKADRIARTTVAAGIVYALITRSVGGPIAVVLGVIAVMLVLTAVTGYCPPYALLGIKTCKCGEHDEKPSRT